MFFECIIVGSMNIDSFDFQLALCSRIVKTPPCSWDLGMAKPKGTREFLPPCLINKQAKKAITEKRQERRTNNEHSEFPACNRPNRPSSESHSIGKQLLFVIRKEHRSPRLCSEKEIFYVTGVHEDETSTNCSRVQVLPMEQRWWNIS